MTTTTTTTKPNPLSTLALLILPVLLLAGVIGLFLYTSGAGLNVQSAAPIESLSFERTILQPGVIEFRIRNTSPQEINIAQININDGIVRYTIDPGHTVPRLGRAVIKVPYPWVQSEAYEVAIFSSNSVAFTTAIDVASETKVADRSTLLSFTLIGLYVGVLPVFLGLFWFPALRRLGPRWMMFLMAITAGLLIYLGIDAVNEALETSIGLGGPFQGVGLIGLGVVVTFMLLDAIARRQVSVGRSEADQRLTVAYMIATGIGLHNLGEGLAIGAAYSVGAATLGTFLVIGFILQNITEGLGIIAPVLRDRPTLSSLAWMGLIGGVPAVVGAWVGGLTYSQPLAVLFLAIGAGAVFEVVYEIGKLIQRDAAKRPMPLTIFAGVTVGMLLLYVTGLLIK
ncbi:MAG: ZIP family metal transporter [Chloroflexi bacterium]|nr:ZIP family metal transporter [Chloroflexota bacterium]